jgi:hypothetical protein
LSGGILIKKEQLPFGEEVQITNGIRIKNPGINFG